MGLTGITALIFFTLVSLVGPFNALGVVGFIVWPLVAMRWRNAKFSTALRACTGLGRACSLCCCGPSPSLCSGCRMTETAVDAPAPTTTFYASLQRAFDHFNGWLFGGQLPPCLITLRPAGWR